MPHLKAVPGVVFRSFVTGSGLTSRAVGLRYGALMCTSDYREVIVDPEVDAVLIATRHDLHAPMVAEAIEAGKHVFVEKPLALNEEQLAPVEATYKKAAISGSGAPQLLVGFNRRFSPLALQMKEALAQGRLVMNYRVNASPVPAGHWHQDAEQGGGRIVGEICHFIDVMQYLTSAEPVEVFAMATLDGDRRSADPDNLVINLTFTEGSVGTIAYVSAGDPSYPKERLEVFGGGMVGVIDNWRTLRVQGNGRRVKKRYWLGTEKGHEQEMKLFVSSIRNGHPT
ncbi:MAG: Gfo/Idh/MocA family protein, partial [bacterium]